MQCVLFVLLFVAVYLKADTEVLMVLFCLTSLAGIEDIPILSYEAVMQHEREML